MLKIKSYDEDGVHEGWVLLNANKILAITYEFDSHCWNIVLSGCASGLPGDPISVRTKRKDVEEILAACGADLGPLAELELRPEPTEEADDSTASD